MPVRQQARQQIRATQEWTIGRGSPAHGDVVSAPGARMTSIEQKFLGGQFGVARGIVQKGRAIHDLAEGARRMNIDLNDARVWGNLQHPQAGIVWRRITFQDDLPIQFGRRLLDRRQELQVVLKMRQRRHEDIQVCIAHFDAKRRSYIRTDLRISVRISFRMGMRLNVQFRGLMPQRHIGGAQVLMPCRLRERCPWRHRIRRQIGHTLG